MHLCCFQKLIDSALPVVDILRAMSRRDGILRMISIILGPMLYIIQVDGEKRVFAILKVMLLLALLK